MKAPLFSLFFVCSMISSLAGDWPAYRHDGQRSAVTGHLPAKLFVQWKFQARHAPETAWPLPGEETPRMHSDRAYHAVVVGRTLVFGNNVDNHVHALDTRTGNPKWSFATDGSVRFAPMIDDGRVYFGSDDGFVYCLNLADGKEIWRHRMGPSGERIIGRSRLVSVWPVRTGVLVGDGLVYAAAGVFPYEGLYIKALDAKTGKTAWVNDTAGDQAWGLQFGGLSPQGYLVASKNSPLYVPAGRSMPASFDKGTGKFKKFLSTGGKIGGSFAIMDGDKLFAGNNNQGTDTKNVYDAETGGRMANEFASYPSIDMVLTKEVAYMVTQKGIYAIDRSANAEAAKKVPGLEKQAAAIKKNIDAIRKRLREAAGNADEATKITAELAKATTDHAAVVSQIARLRSRIEKWSRSYANVGPIVRAGDTIFAGGKGFVIALSEADGTVLMERQIEGHAVSMAVADDRLFVSTDLGAIQCFGPQAVAIGQLEKKLPTVKTANDPDVVVAAKAVLDQTKIDRGWCLIAGARDGRLAEFLAANTQLKIVLVEADAERYAALHARMMATALLGSRVWVMRGGYENLPDYFANLIMSERAMLGDELNVPVDQLARVLRPAGGQLVLGSIKDWPLVSVQKIINGLKANAHAQTTVQLANEQLHFTRGKLKDAGEWSGLYGNTANTSSTTDKLVKGPLGVLWYGEPGSEDMVGRHARAASPLAINGRLIMQGAEVVMGYDAYNGTKLWKRKIRGAVRVRVDVDGSNITANDDSVFVAVGDHVLHLHAQTGETLRKFPVPRKEGDKALRWGYIAIEGDVLLGSGASDLDREYGYLWNVLTKDGEWVAEKDCPKDALSDLKKLKGLFAKPDDRAWDHFQRYDMHWKKINTFPGWLPDHKPSPVNDKIMTSEKVFAYNVKTGKLLWEHEGKGIPNISLVVGNGSVFFLKDDLNDEEKARAKARTANNILSKTYEPEREQKLKESEKDYRRVVCLDLKTGEKTWDRPYDLTGSGGTKLGLAYQDGRVLAFGHYSNHDEAVFNKKEDKNKDGFPDNLAWRRITVIDGGGGSLMWSRPLDYRRRPTIVDDTIYIEPRRADLKTGDIQTRKHPITGKSVEWEFLRPGHSCGIVTATPHNLFFRSYSGAIVNTEQDSGLQLFGGMRPGCWNSMIPANGLLSMQEASAGCTCSYSLRTTVVLKHKPQKGHAEWAVFISEQAKKKAIHLPVSHLAINFGAPGDMRAKDKTVWFAYPRPKTPVGQGNFRNYGLKFDLNEVGATDVVQRDWRGVKFAGTDKPWLYTSALTGATKLTVPLLEKGDKGRFTVRLGFTLPMAGAGKNVFGVKLQGKTELGKLDVAKAAGEGAVMIHEARGVEVEGNLIVELTPPGFEEAAVIDVHPKLHHLGNDVVAGWTDSSPKPEGFVLRVPFNFNGKGDAYSLALTQEHIHNAWSVMLNGREIGRLRETVAREVSRYNIPKGLLKQGANELVVQRAEDSKDDIQVGKVQLLPGHAASTVIQSLEIIREDNKTAAKP